MIICPVSFIALSNDKLLPCTLLEWWVWWYLAKSSSLSLRKPSCSSTKSLIIIPSTGPFGFSYMHSFSVQLYTWYWFAWNTDLSLQAYVEHWDYQLRMCGAGCPQVGEVVDGCSQGHSSSSETSHDTQLHPLCHAPSTNVPFLYRKYRKPILCIHLYAHLIKEIWVGALSGRSHDGNSSLLTKAKKECAVSLLAELLSYAPFCNQAKAFSFTSSSSSTEYRTSQNIREFREWSTFANIIIANFYVRTYTVFEYAL